MVAVDVKHHVYNYDNMKCANFRGEPLFSSDKMKQTTFKRGK